MTAPVGGIDPHQDTFTVGIVDHHGVEITCETFANTARPATSTPSVCSKRTASARSACRAPRSGEHTSRSRSRRRGSTPARYRRRAQQLSAARGDWTRPTPSTQSPQPARCWPSRPWGPSRRWRSMTPSSLRSKRCSSTAEPLSQPEHSCCTTSRTRSPSSPPRSATNSPQAARSRVGCAASNTSTPLVRPPPQARTASAGSKLSSTKTALRAERSGTSSGSSTSCSTATARPCATRTASAPSQQPQRQDQRLESHTEHTDRPLRRPDRRPHQMKTITAGYTENPSVIVVVAGALCQGVTVRFHARR